MTLTHLLHHTPEMSHTRRNMHTRTSIYTIAHTHIERVSVWEGNTHTHNHTHIRTRTHTYRHTHTHTQNTNTQRTFSHTPTTHNHTRAMSLPHAHKHTHTHTHRCWRRPANKSACRRGRSVPARVESELRLSAVEEWASGHLCSEHVRDEMPHRQMLPPSTRHDQRTLFAKV